MRLNEISYPGGQPIEGYGPGFFRIGGEVHTGALLVVPEGKRSWSGYEDIAPILTVKDDIDLLFVGTGAEIAHIPADLRRPLEDAGLGVEVMNSPSACRTYNVLLSEGRRIALATLPV